MGVTFDCPRETEADHRAAWGPHRVAFWFEMPDDGGPPNYDALPRLYMHMGSLEELEHFSVYHRDGRPLDAPSHWQGHLVEGVLYDALSFGAV